MEDEAVGRKSVWERWGGIAAAGLLAAGILLPQPQVQAAETTSTVSPAYTAAERALLQLGAKAENQGVDLQLVRQAGISEDPADIQLADEQMAKLLQEGVFVADLDTLPFVWLVTKTEQVQLGISYTNVLTCSHGLLQQVHHDPDETAALLAQQVAIALQHQPVRRAAQQAGQRYEEVLQQSGSKTNLQPQLLDVLEKTALQPATDIERYASDAQGFYLLADAGGNPGGAVAAMSRLQYMAKNPEAFTGVFRKDDFPDLGRRIERLQTLLKAYSCGHVSVLEGDKVYVDAQLIVQARPLDGYSAEEMAWLAAGGLAKAFHANDYVARWAFFETPEGKKDYLSEDPAYAVLKKLVTGNAMVDTLEHAVLAAYEQDAHTAGRAAQHTADQERRKAWDLQQEKNLSLRDVQVERMEENGDYYNKHQLPKLAAAEMERLIQARPDEARAQLILGVSYRNQEQYDAAVEACTKAIDLKPAYPNAYACRAGIYRRMGRLQEAVADCEKALKLNDQLAGAWWTEAAAYDAQGDTAMALECYRHYKLLEPEAKDIPAAYLAQLVQ